MLSIANIAYWKAAFDALAKFGGLLSLVLITLGFIFREYLKAQITSRFARRLADDKHSKDQKLLLADVSAHLRARVVEKLIDLRLHHIDQLAAQSWSSSDKLTGFVSARLCEVADPKGFELSAMESYLEVCKQLDIFSSALASASAFVPDNLSAAAKRVYGEVLRITRVTRETPPEKELLGPLWALELALSEQVKAAIISTYSMPEALALVQSGGSN